VTRRVGLATAALAFLVLATANAGGYRYGISDQAFYIPALAYRLDPALFPRDIGLFAPQMRLWLGDDIVGWVGRLIPLDLRVLFFVLYLTGLAGLFVATLRLAKSLGLSAWAATATLALFTLRHRIAKTGANTLEGYMHPRMLAFALGLAALACLLRRRERWAAGLVIAAGVVHPTTALWFGVILAAAVLSRFRRARWVAVAAAAAGVLIVARGPVMDPAWLAVLGEKDYLFPSAWPAYAWIFNLAYPIVIGLIFRRRRTVGRTAPGESALVTGLFVLVAGFLVSVPLSALHVATVVQLQVNRIFWVLDAVTLTYLAWWMVDDLGTRRSAWLGVAIVLLLVSGSAARGYRVLVIDAGRPLVQWTAGDAGWAEAMAWLRQRPAGTYVLADPGHAWKYGTSVRVAALKDTLLETGKDSAMAMYDRRVAMQVAERQARVGNFDALTADDFRALRATYGVDVLVLQHPRTAPFPVLFENDSFAIYDLR
jgi:hypothetical protein